MIKMRVQGLSTDPSTQQSIVWLLNPGNSTVLPITIGDTEAMSIYSGLSDQHSPRPLTHDLFGTTLDHLNAKVKELKIVDLKDGIFYAELVLATGKKQLCLDARPSDGIALALKYKAPIYLSEAVLSQAGYAVTRQGSKGVLYLKPLDRSKEPAVSDEAIAAAIDDLLEETEIGASDKPPEQPDDPGDSLKVLKEQMEQAVKLERYEEAGRIQKELERIGREGEKDGS